MTDPHGIDRDTAEKLMAVYRRMGDLINEADDLIRPLPEPIRTELLRGLAEQIADVWPRLQRPVVRAYPDLDPLGDLFQKPHT